MNRKDICKWYEVCPLKRFYEQKVLDERWVENYFIKLTGLGIEMIPENYCWGDYSKCTRYKMEENGVYHPDNMLPDGTIDKKLR